LNERWTGRILSPEEVTNATGVREVRSARTRRRFRRRMLQGTPLPRCQAAERLLHAAARARVPLGISIRTRRGLAGAAGSGIAPARRRASSSSPSSSRRYPEVKIRDASAPLAAMREIKSDAELTLIQRAVDITVEAQKAAMAAAS